MNTVFGRVGDHVIFDALGITRAIQVEMVGQLIAQLGDLLVGYLLRINLVCSGQGGTIQTIAVAAYRSHLLVQSVWTGDDVVMRHRVIVL